jgi:predicted regulator of Ras-like GTPase activity (Roadblock/LC7/MglB family)
MPTIRDLVNVLRRRDGVEAAVVLGRDGLLIDSQVAGSVDEERVAAHVAPILQAADEFGAAADRGPLTTAVLEHPQGLAIVSALSAQAVLLVLLAPDAPIASLLHELRRNREHMASLV